MTDDKIVALYWARSEDAIKETEKAYGSYCYYIAFHILHEKQDANETVNDTYLKAWQNMPPQKPNPLKAFLGRITRQLSINRLEKRNATKRGGEYALSLDELENVIGDNTQDIADQVALSEALTRFLYALPITQRRIFVRRYWYFESINEIASTFSISESKVKSMLMRLRQKLKQHLEQEGFEL